MQSVGLGLAESPMATPPYDPTVCHPLANASSLPKKCLGPQWSLDAPCPKCWENPYPDYNPKANSTFLPAAVKALMQARLDSYLNALETEAPPSRALNGGTVFSGLGGRALLLLKLHEVTHNATYWSKAQEYVQAMEAKLNSQKVADRLTGEVGFMWSHVGMLCVSALAADRAKDPAKVQSLVAQVVALFKSLQGKYDDFDSGRAGLIYASRFLDANLNASGAPYVPRPLVLGVANAIIDRGVATGRVHGNKFMQWHGPNDAGLWLGQSHGTAGVVQQLLAVPELLQNESAKELIGITLDHLVSTQFASGNFPAEYYNATQDVLVQWDHGAPGVSACLLAAWKAFESTPRAPKYLASAVRALDVTWKRGLIFKGLMNCHGLGGNTWMQTHAYKMTGNATYLYRAIAFQTLAVTTPLLSEYGVMRVPQPSPDATWGFWVGSVESAIELWTDWVYRGPENASETGFEVGL